MADWVNIDKKAGTQGTNKINVTVGENTGKYERTAEYTIMNTSDSKSQKLKIQQQGKGVTLMLGFLLNLQHNERMFHVTGSSNSSYLGLNLYYLKNGNWIDLSDIALYNTTLSINGQVTNSAQIPLGIQGIDYQFSWKVEINQLQSSKDDRTILVRVWDENSNKKESQFKILGTGSGGGITDPDDNIEPNPFPDDNPILP